MSIDPIDIRIGNYFEYNGQVLEINLEHLKRLTDLLPRIKPIQINGFRLSRLDFTCRLLDNKRQHMYHRFGNNVDFMLLSVPNNKFILFINENVKIGHIQYIHQLQNIFYDLTGVVLKRPPPGEINAPKKRG